MALFAGIINDIIVSCPQTGGKREKAAKIEMTIFELRGKILIVPPIRLVSFGPTDFGIHDIEKRREIC
jgi:hypothetical protein